MEVLFYELPNGEKPVIDFLESLDDKTRIKSIGVISLLKEKGCGLREPYSKKVRNNIFELRIKKGSNNIRILYFYAKGNKAYLTNGFIKKTRKTPEEELIMAEKYYSEYVAGKE
ncbi:MAG: type II toxin-antitoxin system RelE/ParE family toxin [Erysipelotrichaceae bacterium]|nr:type II toxin-antitoxin system RelE/ParE family toxin [Erysipelotrichaceae bacterium]